MSVFLVLQKPGSIYADKDGVGYEYPTSIPNGRQIEEGDHLVCCLTAKTSEDGRRIFGIGRVEYLTHYEKNGREYAFAEYRLYREFTPPLTFEEIGGDPRTNRQFAMNRIPADRGEDILEILLSDNRQYTLIVDKSATESVEQSHHSVEVWNGDSEDAFVLWLDEKLAEGWKVIGINFEDTGSLKRRCVFARS